MVVLKINRHFKETYGSTAFPSILIFLILVQLTPLSAQFYHYSFKLNLFPFTPLILVSMVLALVMLVEHWILH